MEKETTKALVLQALQGDETALETLVLEVKNLVFNLSLRMLGNVEDANDATQEILIKIITRLSSYRAEALFSTWVYRITSNYLINEQKSQFTRHL